MKIQLLNPHGYCKGVVLAISKAIIAKKEYPNQTIYILGQIVHNKLVNEALNKLGIITLNPKNLDDILNIIKDGVIILTAHGTSKEIINKIKEKGLTLIDTTCQFVDNSFKSIEKLLSEGNDIIYVGKANHPEAIAALSINKYRIHLVSSINDIVFLPDFSNPLYLTNQTTMSKDDILSIYETLKNKYPNIKLQDEQCNATSLRQNTINNLENTVDLVLIVGDKGSNNSTKLFELASKKTTAYLIESVEDIKIEWLKDKNYIAITSGASTPEYLTNSVIKWLQQFNYLIPHTHLKPSLENNLILKEFQNL